MQMIEVGRKGKFYTLNGKVVKPEANTKEAQKAKTMGKFFPFCSQRCKLIDMGAWFDSEYKIPVDEED